MSSKAPNNPELDIIQELVYKKVTVSICPNGFFLYRQFFPLAPWEDATVAVWKHLEKWDWPIFVNEKE